MSRFGPTGPLHASSSPEADGDLAVLDDDRHLAAAGETDHPRELVFVLFDVEVVDRVFPTRVVLTGRRRVGSGVFAENLDALGGHLTSAAQR